MSKTHHVYEPDSVYDKLKEKGVDVGDNIEYIPNNQLGYERYKVVNILGKKDLDFIGDIYDSYDKTYDFSSKYNKSGGKIRSTRKTIKKRKSIKNCKTIKKRKTIKNCKTIKKRKFSAL